jgi:hypothetical protein
MREFFESHPRTRVGLLLVFIALGVFMLPRAIAFGEYFAAALLAVGLPAMIYSLIVILRSRGQQRD